jgi:hypothetical protein
MNTNASDSESFRGNSRPNIEPNPPQVVDSIEISSLDRPTHPGKKLACVENRRETPQPPPCDRLVAALSQDGDRFRTRP